jgi:septal ring factor EnvC (AmiA/AmiB activator)
MSKTQQKGRSVEELVGAMSAQLEKIVEKLQETNERLDQQEARFDKLESFLKESREENRELKEQLRVMNVEVKQLQQKVNDIEQHNRSYNIRIFNLPIEGDKADTRNVMKQVFAKLLSPILQGAVERGRLHSRVG